MILKCSYKTFRSVVGWIWISCILFLLCYVFIINPRVLELDYMVEKIQSYQQQISIVYIAISLCRCLLLLPPTPFFLLGIALFPEAKLFVLMVGLASSWVSTCFFYFLAQHFGWDKFFEKKYPKRMAKIKSWLSNPKAFWFIIAWSMTPIAPSDLLAYTAGIIPIRFRILIIGMTIGQLPILIAYLYLGDLFL